MRSFVHPPGAMSIRRALRAWALPVLVLAMAAAPASEAMADAAPPPYQLSAHVSLGAGKRWDYVTLDGSAGRIYLAHADKVEVIDVQTRTRVGTISGLQGTHGVATAPLLGRGFISDGKANAVVIFDLRSLAVLRAVPVGRNPDAIVFDPLTGRIAVFNGASHDATILDAATGTVITASLPLGGKPEFARLDSAGRAYVNIEDTAEVAIVDLKEGRVLRRYSIAPCDEPTGLAITPMGQLISVCHNHLAVLSDPATGSVLATAPIGERPDGVVFDDGYAFSANGGDGTISVLAVSAGTAAAIATIPSRRTARTIEVDPRTHTLYLPSLAEAPVGVPATAGAAAADAGGARQTTEADAIEILVVTRQ